MAILGCIADDFTGASDLASFLVKGGMKTVLYNGIPDQKTELADVDACVIALKTRTEEKEKAVRISLEAVKWLQSKKCRHFYIKYCSTFDSTKEGNIGPICDTVLEYLGEKFTVLCPALPVNGRTVKNGRLSVNGVPLYKSSMKDHPLTPMWTDSIPKLMEVQSKYPVYVQKAGNWKILDTEKHYYLVPDYETDEDCKKIVEQFGNLKLITGGSGLAEELAKKLLDKQKKENQKKMHSLLLAGSCSVATRSQIKFYQKLGKKSLQITPEMAVEKEKCAEKLWKTVKDWFWEQNVLIYSSDEPEKVEAAQKKYGDVSEKLETIMAYLAEKAVAAGVKNIIVAGGETSGAVTRQLGMESFLIGESVAPGVPIMIPTEKRDMRLVLKSGNFGQEDFFRKALFMMEEK